MIWAKLLLKDYEVHTRKCPPWVKIARLTVPRRISFNFCFFPLSRWPFLIIDPSDFWILAALICCPPTIEFKLTIVTAATLHCYQCTVDASKLAKDRLAVVRLAVSVSPPT